jgi:hypothetical protein
MATKIFSKDSHGIAFMPVMDNLENSITTQLLDMEWRETVLENNYKKIFLIIDDNVMIRWIRQVCRQYSMSSHKNIGLHHNDFIDFLLYNKITCNKITDHQKDYYEQAKNFSKNVILFKLTNKLGYMINHFLYDNGIPNKFNNLLQVDNENKNSLILKKFLDEDINKPYLDKIKQYLNDDIDFVEGAKFYAR